MNYEWVTRFGVGAYLVRMWVTRFVVGVYLVGVSWC